MKNITVLSVLVIIIGALTANNSAYCQNSTKERSYIFSFGTQFGFVHGLAFEYVYPEPGTTKGELLSELRWDMKPVFFNGIQFDFGRKDLMSNPGFFASASFKAGFPGESGIHENRDWLSYENDALTSFSSHTNKTNEFYWLDIILGASFPVRQYFFIKPFISGSWMHFSYSGSDGYGQYARGKKYDDSGNPIPDNSSYPTMFFPINDDPKIYSFKGREVIRYMQDWFLIAAGFTIGTKILSPFYFDISFHISPFTYCAATDEHLTRNIIFKDYTGWGLFLEPKGNISIDLDNINFSLELAYRFIGRTRGPSFNKSGSGNYVPGGEAGAGLSLLDTRFIIRVII